MWSIYIYIYIFFIKNKETNLSALSPRPTEQPPFVGKVSFNFCG
jgi:hypothetical protein